ncbi:hypothetical protein DPMN_149802 [Dreissena polymorpha]|uniref:Uncharacterized protein n=1 Tax=Dreissena polymorpha TaxID=45954 RepID=A0A9D4J519_DREPO|nr:hypothetical protein DPMN_149802 [Dreissena polymorpha]
MQFFYVIIFLVTCIGLPEILDFSGKTSISHVELECRAIGQPVPTVTVTSVQQPVTSDLSGHTVTKFQLDGIVGKRVTINAGRVMTQYTCIAENRQGKDQLTITGLPNTLGFYRFMNMY